MLAKNAVSISYDDIHYVLD